MGFLAWNSVSLWVALATFLEGSHVKASLVFSYPFHAMRYLRCLHLMRLLRTLLTSNSGSESISIEGGGLMWHPGISEVVAGSRSET